MSAPRGKNKALGALNEGKAVKLAEWQKSGDETDMKGNPWPRWSEWIIGYLDSDEAYAFYKVKQGTRDGPYDNRELHNSSQRRAGTAGEFLQKEKAREYIENTDWDSGGIDNFERLLEIREEIKKVDL